MRETLQSCLLCLLLAAYAIAQENDANHAAFVFTGNAQSTFANLTNSSIPDGLERSFSPGAELIFKPKSRVSVGVSFKEFRSEEATFSSVNVSDGSRAFSNSDGSVTVIDPNEIVWSFDLRMRDTTRAVSGLAYVNILTHGRVRPFVGGGVGVGFVRSKYQATNIYVHPAIEDPREAVDASNFGTVSSRVFFPVAKAGVHVFAGKHFFVGGAGGYRTGRSENSGSASLSDVNLYKIFMAPRSPKFRYTSNKERRQVPWPQGSPEPLQILTAFRIGSYQYEKLCFCRKKLLVFRRPVRVSFRTATNRFAYACFPWTYSTQAVGWPYEVAT